MCLTLAYLSDIMIMDVDGETESFMDKVWGFISKVLPNLYQFKEIFIVLIVLGVILKLLMKKEGNVSEDMSHKSMLFFGLVLIPSILQVQKTIDNHVKYVCPLRMTNVIASGDLFQIEYDTKGSVVFSFVYYYILTYVKFFVLAVLMFSIFMFLYIIIVRQMAWVSWKRKHSLFTAIKSGNFKDLMGIDPRKMKFSFSSNPVFAFFEALLRYVPEKIGDILWYIVGIPFWGDKFHPHEYMDFFSMKNVFDVQLHAFIFLCGLVISVMYAYVFIQKSPNMCESEAARNKLKADFKQGHFFVAGLIVVVYLSFFAKQMFSTIGVVGL